MPLARGSSFPRLERRSWKVLQLNLGHRCNQSCVHCHVAAGPNRTETMSRETAVLALEFVESLRPECLDLTGGAPEIHDQFRFLVTEARNLGVGEIVDRCNLTILEEPGHQDLAEFLAAQRVTIVASLPCYTEETVDAQRGKGVFRSSLRGLRRLNALGYGQPGSGLVLDLVFNPQGAVLPPPQAALQTEYRKRLKDDYQIVFNQLFTLTNMPIRRFESILVSQGRYDEYLALLKASYREENLEAVMCLNLVSVDWQGSLFDCDFNQMLDLPLRGKTGERVHLREAIRLDPKGLPIVVANHCYGCTAGQGSSCGGALVEPGGATPRNDLAERGLR